MVYTPLVCFRFSGAAAPTPAGLQAYADRWLSGCDGDRNRSSSPDESGWYLVAMVRPCAGYTLAAMYRPQRRYATCHDYCHR